MREAFEALAFALIVTAIITACVIGGQLLLGGMPGALLGGLAALLLLTVGLGLLTRRNG